MPRWYALVTVLSSAIISESVYKGTDCSQLGNYTLRPKIRKGFATAILRRVYRDDLSRPLEYQCFLEGLAALILENPGKPSKQECPFSVATLPLYFEIKKVDGINIHVAIAAAMATWERFLQRMTPADSFGCNYLLDKHRKHKLLCLFSETHAYS